MVFEITLKAYDTHWTAKTFEIGEREMKVIAESEGEAKRKAKLVWREEIRKSGTFPNMRNLVIDAL